MLRSNLTSSREFVKNELNELPLAIKNNERERKKRLITGITIKMKIIMIGVSAT